jgi:L-histidine N-alpha-methyltransferase
MIGDSLPMPVVVAPGLEGSSLARDVRAGLAGDVKALAPKHLYDERGSELFDQICTLPEYYPTRTERAILESCAASVIDRTGAHELVELGSGTASKTRLLLDAMQAGGTLRSYVPFDISEVVVRDCAAAIASEYPDLREIQGIVGDFEHHLDLIPPAEGERIVALLGGTIGNFPPPTHRRVLSSIAGLLGPADHMLLGADLVKDPEVISAAYNDSAGVTAEFNLNVLSVINRELRANFQPSNFEHVARYDSSRDWIEMRLRARDACVIHIADLDLDVRFAAGEEMLTEISAKFTPERISTDLEASGLSLVELYVDDAKLYSLILAKPLAGAPDHGPPTAT